MLGAFLLRKYAPGSTFVNGRKLFLVISTFLCLQCCTTYHAKPLDESAVAKGLKPPAMESVRIQAGKISHPTLKPVEIDFTKGLTADQAAIVAVIQNPALRAARDQKGIASAQLLQAGILPNPTFAYALDFPTGGRTQGTVKGYGLTLDWDVTSLMTHNARVDAARAYSASVNLDIAWKEWQVAQAAKQHVYRFAFLKEQLSLATEEEKRLREHLDSVKKAVALGNMTVLDMEAADAAFQRVHTSVLEIARNLEQERLALNSVLGFPPEYVVPLQAEIILPSPETFPTLKEITDGLETRRLDLLALKMGYQSQEDKLRAAVLAQFPNISIGPTHLRDTGDVVTTGFTVSISLPVFDRNQGQIAIEKATREQLFDEYLSRLFEARAQVASLLANMGSIEKQIDAEEKTATSLRKLVETSYNGFLEGNIDALSYYNELDRLFTKQLDVLKFKQDLADFGIALEIAAGEYLGRLELKEESKR
jgi:cobalt-zinc-cadmium efflux system outer membrane protein